MTSPGVTSPGAIAFRQPGGAGGAVEVWAGERFLAALRPVPEVQTLAAWAAWPPPAIREADVESYVLGWIRGAAASQGHGDLVLGLGLGPLRAPAGPAQMSSGRAGPGRSDAPAGPMFRTGPGRFTVDAGPDRPGGGGSSLTLAAGRSRKAAGPDAAMPPVPVPPPAPPGEEQRDRCAMGPPGRPFSTPGG